MRILKMTVKITNLINESTGCFVLNCMPDAFEQVFFSCGSVVLKRVLDKWDNSIFCSGLPLVYFIYESECTCTLVCLIHKIVPVTSKFKEGVMSEVTNQSINCCVTQITTWTTKDKHWKV